MSQSNNGEEFNTRIFSLVYVPRSAVVSLACTVSLHPLHGRAAA